MVASHRVHTLRHVARHWLSADDRCLSIPSDPQVPRAAHVHRMTPIVASLIQQGRLDVGSRHVHDAVLFRARRQGIRSRYLLGELSWIATTFAAEGVPYLTFGGPTLSRLAWGDPGLWSARELDVLVRPADANAADALLRGRGYRRRPADWKRSSHVDYTAPGPGGVALRWRLLPGGAGGRWPDPGLWRRAALLDLGGATVSTIPPGDLALYLAIHGGNRGWTRLGWLVGFAALGRRLDSWPEILGQATATATGRWLLLAWTLARDLLDEEPPAALADGLGTDPGPAAVARRVARRLHGTLRGRSRVGVDRIRRPGLVGRFHRLTRPLRLATGAARRLVKPGKGTSHPRGTGVRLFFRPPVRLRHSPPPGLASRPAPSRPLA